MLFELEEHKNYKERFHVLIRSTHLNVYFILKPRAKINDNEVTRLITPTIVS